MKLSACTECINHFGITDNDIWQTTDARKCDYHTDYTGRGYDKDRLSREWSSPYPMGWERV